MLRVRAEQGEPWRQVASRQQFERDFDEITVRGAEVTDGGIVGESDPSVCFPVSGVEFSWSGRILVLSGVNLSVSVMDTYQLSTHCL